MKFEIYQGEKIEVRLDNKLYLRGDLVSGCKYHVKLYRDEAFILEWSRPALLLLRTINLRYQDLPIPILNYYHRGLFGFELQFGENLIYIKLRPLRKASFHIYLNYEKVGEVFYPPKPTFGYSLLTIITSSEDETINFYIVLAFLIQLLPVL
jgi:hypothetical protein